MDLGEAKDTLERATKGDYFANKIRNIHEKAFNKRTKNPPVNLHKVKQVQDDMQKFIEILVSQTGKKYYNYDEYDFTVKNNVFAGTYDVLNGNQNLGQLNDSELEELITNLRAEDFNVDYKKFACSEGILKIKW